MKETEHMDKSVLNIEAPLLNDYIFKRTFTKEGTEPMLRDFLEAILEKRITKVDVKNSEIPKERLKEKASILDIRAEIDGKQIVDIEMQVENKGDIKQRGPLYMCRNIATQINKGNKYKELKPSIAIWILNFNCFKINSYHSVANMMFNKRKNRYVDMGYKDEEEIATDMIEMHFIEMPKFIKKNPGVEDKLDQWLWLISGKGEKIEMAEKKNRNVKEALARVDEIMQDEEIMDLHFDLAVARMDYENGMRYAKKTGMEMGLAEGKAKGLAEGHAEGHAEGRAEGLAEGLEEGRKEGIKEGLQEGMREGQNEAKIEIAKALLEDKQPIDYIMKITRLSIEEIEKLKT